MPSISENQRIQGMLVRTIQGKNETFDFKENIHQLK